MTTSNTYLPDGLPAPAATNDKLDAPYWDGARKHELWVQRCNACAGYQWGPEWICHACRSFDVGWVQVSGKARVYAWERVWHPVHPALKDACPYLVVLVELPDADDVRMVGNLLGDAMQSIPIGAEVEVVYEDRGDGDAAYTLVQWRLVE